MKMLLGLLAILTFLIGIGSLAMATSAVANIMGGIMLVISAIFLGSSSIMESVDSLKKYLKDQQK